MEIFYLGLLMSTGFAVASALERVGIPRVASYVFVGILLSESLAGRWFPSAPGGWTETLTSTTLGVIAFHIGAEIDAARVKRNAKAIAGVLLGQSVGILAMVGLLLLMLPAFFPGLFPSSVGASTAILLAIIAVATAPAGTLAVIEDYHARGELTAILLAVVAIDDMLAIIFFTVAASFLAGISPAAQFLDAVLEIALALAAGAGTGAVLGWLGRFVHRSDLRLPMILAAIFLNLGLSELFDYPDLLSNIVMGYTAMRIFRKPQHVWIEPMEHVRDTIFLLFFTLAGTHFDPAVFASALPLILVYCGARFAGKWGGAYAGASLVGASDDMRKWSGLAMMPQAGVAIGLALHASVTPGLQEAAESLVNIVIGATIIFELLSPSLTKLALERAGEIDMGAPKQANSPGVTP